MQKIIPTLQPLQHINLTIWMEGYCVKENLWWSAIVALIKLKIQLEDTTLKKKIEKSYL